jgi:enoyl-CoA hydratase/carnithine racemase
MTEHIKVANEGGVLTITLSRPEKKNALTNEMYRRLAEAVAGAESDSSVLVLLFRGEGDVFTAGNDIGDFVATASGKSNEERYLDRFLRNLVKLSKPAVAAVQGRADGIGTTMLLHCDFVVLAENAKLSTPSVNLALVPEAWSTVLLLGRIGRLRAFEMLALGDPVDAQTALSWGLANRVVPLGTLDVEAMAVANGLSRQPLGSLVATKRLRRDVPMMKARIDLEHRHFSERLNSAEAKEAFAVFTERRAPDFSKFAKS